MFTNIAVEEYETSELASEIDLNTYCYNFSSNLMLSFMERCGEYNDAFNMDKGAAFAVPDIDFDDFVPINLLSLSIKNIYGDEYAISDPSNLDKDFVFGFMDFFTNTLSDVTRNFENFSL